MFKDYSSSTGRFNLRTLDLERYCNLFHTLLRHDRFDAAGQIKGRKRFLTVDTLGLVLRVFVAAASVGERKGGKQVLQRVHRMDTAVSRLHTIWVDGGFDGEPFMQWVIMFAFGLFKSRYDQNRRS